jgi:hypothetical protein
MILNDAFDFVFGAKNQWYSLMNAGGLDIHDPLSAIAAHAESGSWISSPPAFISEYH